MKNFFKSLMVCGLFALMGGIITSCTPDNGGDYDGPPVLEIGEPNVINALKVEIPLNAKKLTSIGYKVVAEGENAPSSAIMVFRSGSKIEGNPEMLALSGDDGLDTFYVLLDTYFRKGGFAMHGNVFDADTLKKAQANPEKYRNLQVRVCGWNAYFVNLSKVEQDCFIRQAEAIC